METKLVVESLLNNVGKGTDNQFDIRSNFRKTLELCRIINKKDRDWNNLSHSELNTYTNKFVNPIVICTVTNILNCLIIEPTSFNRVYPVISIIGNNSYFYNWSKNNIYKELKRTVDFKDYLPSPACRQIYFIDRFNEADNKANVGSRNINAIIFSEYSRGIWTIDPHITNVNPTNKTNMTTNIILKELLKQI